MGLEIALGDRDPPSSSSWHDRAAEEHKINRF
jgi:hypothetical protein